ncbi:hypothetical protein HMPREF2136_00855 [Prevotella bivia DNF00650]|uniref:Uncharacterized protein n=1 Tax=Prevotella bivia TaxID=28125 RepID=A0A137T100_9BACT|nr:hypothetical protein HMPREF2136_00855 [Prevotella bivia DNF00650]KXO18391.1 hypothetical protein HMPREF3202_00122 [Prevotella bivia]KXU59784.1 hypothetical protein HMPREF3218_0200410 [Prevotella bivia]
MFAIIIRFYVFLFLFSSFLGLLNDRCIPTKFLLIPKVLQEEGKLILEAVKQEIERKIIG